MMVARSIDQREHIMATRFNDKPLIRFTVYDHPDGGDNWYANTVADHIEEHLDRAGFRTEATVVDEVNPKWSYQAVAVTNTGDYLDFGKDLDLVKFDAVSKAASIIIDVSNAALAGHLSDVFHPDNPDNAMHDDYCRETTVEQAISDAFFRERLFGHYPIHEV
jgi:hypothetical protein